MHLTDENKAKLEQINVYINNTFEGSRDVQKTASTAMKKSTSDTTGELARALAYAR